MSDGVEYEFVEFFGSYALGHIRHSCDCPLCGVVEEFQLLEKAPEHTLGADGSLTGRWRRAGKSLISRAERNEAVEAYEEMKREAGVDQQPFAFKAVVQTILNRRAAGWRPAD